MCPHVLYVECPRGPRTAARAAPGAARIEVRTATGTSALGASATCACMQARGTAPEQACTAPFAIVNSAQRRSPSGRATVSRRVAALSRSRQPALGGVAHRVAAHDDDAQPERHTQQAAEGGAAEEGAEALVR